MKSILRIILALICFPIGTQIKAQSIKRIKDPHIVGQEKRQVFQEWGDWRPKAKYFLGVQTNLHYATVWGWLAPDRNQRYRNGADIRPLAPAGLQNQRYASTVQQERKSLEVLEEVKGVYDDALADQLHYSSLTVPADPLYVLYYQSMLRDLQEFNTNSPNGAQWGFTNAQAFERFQRLGMLGQVKRKIDVLQNTLQLAKTMEIPRGKRIMMFHECLIEWRKQKNYITYLDRQGINRIKAEERLEKLKTAKRNGQHSQARKDAEIFVDVYLRNPY